MNNNYILARWRDAITDPPPDGRVVLLHDTIMGVVAAQRVTEINPVGKTIHGWRMVPYRGALTPQPGDQWLDITTIPGVPREAMRAAMDHLAWVARLSGCQCTVCDAIRAMCRELGIVPTEVQ